MNALIAQSQRTSSHRCQRARLRSRRLGLEALESRELLAADFPFSIAEDQFLRDGQPVFLNMIGYSPLEPEQGVADALHIARLLDDLRRFREYAGRQDPLILRLYPQPTPTIPQRFPQEFFDGLREIDIWVLRDIYFDGDFRAPDAVAKGTAAIDAVIAEAEQAGALDRLFAFEWGNEFIAPLAEAYTPDDADQLRAFLQAMRDHVKTRMAEPAHAGATDWFTWGSLPSYDPLFSDNSGIPVLLQSVDFYAFNIYPYFPEQLRDHQPGSTTGTDYQGYLEALKAVLGSDKPLVISETGLPDSNSAVDQQLLHPWYPAYRYGGLSGDQVAEGIADRYWDARLSGVVAGFGSFQWNDEWWKVSPANQQNDHPEDHYGVSRFVATGADTYELRYKLQQDTLQDLFALRFRDVPTFLTGVTANDLSLPVGGSTGLHASLDVNAVQPVRFRWESSRGRVVGDSGDVQFFAGDAATGPARVTVIAIDGAGQVNQQTLTIQIEAEGAASLELLTSGSAFVSGRVANVDLDQYKVILYVQTDKLYQQPYLASPASPEMTSIWVGADGYFWTPVHNGFAGTIDAWVVARGYDPPDMPPIGFAPPAEVLVTGATFAGINDTDNDMLPDSWEQTHFGSIASQSRYGDPDGDLAYNVEEFLAGRLPATPDNDADTDGLADTWERQLLATLTFDAASDPDQDGLSNLNEQTAGLHPGRTAVDRDRDGLPDRWENRFFGSLARTGAEDTNGDGIGNLLAYERGVSPTRTTVFDAQGLVVTLVLDPGLTAPNVTLTRDGTAVGSGNQVRISRAVQPGDYREILVLDTNGFGRLHHPDADAAPGSEDRFGTSFVLPPGLILNDGSGPEDFYLNARVTQWNLLTDQAASGSLKLEMSGAPANGLVGLAPVSVAWDLTLLGPLAASVPGDITTDATQIDLAVQARFDQETQLSSSHLAQAEAFRAASLSSANTDPSEPFPQGTHDSDQLLLTARSSEAVASLDLTAAARGQFLFPQGAVFDGALHLNQVTPGALNGDTPNMRVRIWPAPDEPDYRGQGYITATTDFNLDNLGAWISRSFASPTIAAGTQFAWGLEITASDASGSIAGQTWQDYDQDGSRQAWEPGMNGWTVQLVDAATDTVLAQQTARGRDLDANGSIDPLTERGWYEFAFVPPGTYEVREGPRSDWNVTSPALGYHSVSLAVGDEPLAGRDFGNWGLRPWQNPIHPLDVDMDGFVKPLDVLIVINHANDPDYGVGQLPAPPAPPKTAPYYLDTNGDGVLSAIDALLIINALNRTDGEGESQPHPVSIDELLGPFQVVPAAVPGIDSPLGVTARDGTMYVDPGGPTVVTRRPGHAGREFMIRWEDRRPR